MNFTAVPALASGAFESKFWFKKAITIFFTFAIMFLVGSSNLGRTFICLGLSHIFISYFYSYKSHLLGRRQIGFLILFTALSFGTFIYSPNVPFLTILTTLWFSAHFLQDEVYLASEKANLWKLIEIVPAFLLLLAYILSIQYQYIGDCQNWPCYETYFDSLAPQSYLKFFVYLASFVYVVLLFLVFIAKIRPSPSSLCFYFLFFFGVFIYFSGQSFHLSLLLGPIAIYHYVSWYVEYIWRYWHQPKKLTPFCIHVFSFNAVAIGLGILFYSGVYEIPVLWLFYRPESFYIWTIGHLLFSLRKSDMQFFAWN